MFNNSQISDLTFEEGESQKFYKSNLTGSMTNFLLSSAKSTFSNGFKDNNTTPNINGNKFYQQSNCSSAGRTPMFLDKKKHSVFFF